MSVHSREELARLGRVARREFSRALMSDTKWRKLFAILADRGLALHQLRVKFIEVEDARTIDVPPAGAVDVPWPYIDTIEFGPAEFRAIEWLEVPAIARFPRPDKVPAQEVRQDIESVETALAVSGLYPIERSEAGLRIVGYRR